jgi:hypothetical protein
MRSVWVALIVWGFIFCPATRLTAQTSLGEIEFSVMGAASVEVEYPLDQVVRALARTLRELGLAVDEDIDLVHGRKILCQSNKLKIEIEMRRLVDNITRIDVDAKLKQYIVERDPVAEELIIESVRAKLAGH